MPYKVFGNCVHKLNADDSKGELVKCHDNKEEANRHMRALYANVEDSIQEFSMAIIKATTSKSGEMKWRSASSDTEKDYYGERMSTELFRDFVSHIENDDPFPEAFSSVLCERDWCGGMPYVSLAHYKTGTNKVNVPGEVSSIYVDGDNKKSVLKSMGVLYDNPLGNAVFKSLQNDFIQKRDDKVRISIGFLDLEHSHGDKFTFVRKAVGQKCPLCAEGIGDKIYKKGYLVHLALTRVPANPRTDMLLEKSMTTKLEDAKSIVEDEEVLKDLELKSLAEAEVLVIKSDDKDADDKGDEEMKDGKKKKKEEMEEESVSTPAPEPVVPVSPVAEQVIETPSVVASTTDPRGYKEIETPVFSDGTVNTDTSGNYTVKASSTNVVVVPAASPVEKSIASLQSKILALKSQGASGEAALAELQGMFDELGNVVKAEFTPAPSPTELAKQDLANTVRSVLQEMLPQYLAQIVAPMQSEVTELRALSAAKTPTIKKEEIPQPRSLNVNLVQKQAIEQLVQKTKMSQFDRIAQQSVGLQVD